MSDPVVSNSSQCQFDLLLIKQEILTTYGYVLNIHLSELKRYFRETKQYGVLTSSIAKFYPEFFKSRYKFIRTSDITYYYLYFYKLSLEESPQPIIWRPTNTVVINLASVVYVVPAQRFPFVRIVGRRHSRFGRRTGFDYLVVWEGQWSANQQQWIPRRRITGASELISDFNETLDN